MAITRMTIIRPLLDPKNLIIVFLITAVITLVKQVDIADVTLRRVFANFQWSNNHSINRLEEKEIQPNCPIKLVTSDKEFLDYFYKIEGQCSSWKTFGRTSGLKYICLDPKFNIKPGNCTVLSFGINNEWSFDDDVDKFNCKVYSFDPTMGKEDHQRSKNIKFLALGIGNLDGEAKVGFGERGFKSRKVARYETILKRIGLMDTTIDYLKIDVDFAELNFLMDVFVNSPHLLKNIKQIGMEVHHYLTGNGLGYNSLFQLFWVAFQKLKCHGFKLYRASKPSRWHEVVWAQEGDW